MPDGGLVKLEDILTQIKPASSPTLKSYPSNDLPMYRANTQRTGFVDCSDPSKSNDNNIQFIRRHN